MICYFGDEFIMKSKRNKEYKPAGNSFIGTDLQQGALIGRINKPDNVSNIRQTDDYKTYAKISSMISNDPTFQKKENEVQYQFFVSEKGYSLVLAEKQMLGTVKYTEIKSGNFVNGKFTSDQLKELEKECKVHPSLKRKEINEKQGSLLSRFIKSIQDLCSNIGIFKKVVEEKKEAQQNLKQSSGPNPTGTN